MPNYHRISPSGYSPVGYERLRELSDRELVNEIERIRRIITTVNRAYDENRIPELLDSLAPLFAAKGHCELMLMNRDKAVKLQMNHEQELVDWTAEEELEESVL